MTTIQSEVFEAPRSILKPGDNAIMEAVAMSKRDHDAHSLKSELLVIKWMIGLVLAFQVAIFGEMFVH